LAQPGGVVKVFNGTYLARRNVEQRRAAEHGTNSSTSTKSGPVLVIAGAGTGKTDTLAHRVAHLIANGIDPRRILLMTFSHRAAAGMTRRVERICAPILGNKAAIMSGALAEEALKLQRTLSGGSLTIVARGGKEDLGGLTL
jgi:DNA helicase II / ATP-dependent DNA helicase PcrA